MPATWLDIVDTVVKIGLGAVISGFATLSVTKYKFRSDKELASAQRRSVESHLTKLLSTQRSFLISASTTGPEYLTGLGKRVLEE